MLLKEETKSKPRDLCKAYSFLNWIYFYTNNIQFCCCCWLFQIVIMQKPQTIFRFQISYIYFLFEVKYFTTLFLHSTWGISRGQVANELDCWIVGSKFKIKSDYYILLWCWQKKDTGNAERVNRKTYIYIYIQVTETRHKWSWLKLS